MRRPNRVVQVGENPYPHWGGLIDEGPGWQDRKAMHTSVNLERRVRQYMFTKQKSDEARSLVRRAARREFETAEMIRHPNVQRPLEFREHENGPALLFDYDPTALRLDHYVAQSSLSIETKLHLIRQIAEVMAYAHSRKVLHRALSPRCVLVHEPKSERPNITVMNWQTSLRTEGSTTGTIHVRALVEDESLLYMAPEAFITPDNVDVHADIFSLGAITHFVFTGAPPAADLIARDEVLRENEGLRPSSVIDGVPADLDDLVQMSTNPNALARIEQASEFLEMLAALEEELTTPHEAAVHPLQANPNDPLEGGFTLVRRLGSGGVSHALLAKRGDQELVLKVARTPAENATLEHEGRILQQLRDRHVVQWLETRTMSGRSTYPKRGGASGHQAGEPRRGVAGEEAAGARPVRLLAVARPARQHSGGDAAISGSVPVAAPSPALGPARRALRGRGDAVRDGDGRAAALGERRGESRGGRRCPAGAGRGALRPRASRGTDRLLRARPEQGLDGALRQRRGDAHGVDGGLRPGHRVGRLVVGVPGRGRGHVRPGRPGGRAAADAGAGPGAGSARRADDARSPGDARSA